MILNKDYIRTFFTLSVLIALMGATISLRAAEFRPGQVWLNTNGKPINAHGAWIRIQWRDSWDLSIFDR